MTMDELEAALKADPEKEKAFKEALAGMTKEKAGSDAEAISLAAKAAGLEMTPEEVERALAAGMELDEAELEDISGGTSEHGNFCYVGWHCYAFFLHTADTDKDQTTCWDDYICAFSYHQTCTYNYSYEALCVMFYHYTRPEE